MSSLAVPPELVSATLVFFGHYGQVSHQAHERGVCRQTLYREADQVLRALDPRPHAQECQRLGQQVADLHASSRQLEERLAHAVVLDADKQAEFATTAQAS